MKHPKLVGADIYVVRLNNASSQKISTGKLRKGERRDRRRQSEPKDDEKLEADDSDACSISSKESITTGSLHDELTFCHSKVKGEDSPKDAKIDCTESDRMVAESRPCYRCVSYMHSVGIKRVFWTNNDGRWEGAKVRDLIDQLEGTVMNGTDPSLRLPSPEVFITKHEVLLLRRLMMSDGQ